MSFFVVLSGLINLSSQALYQKVVSMVAGDLYTTFLVVTLTFITGSALGSYFGYRLRRLLPWLELISGVYSLLIGFLLSGSIYAYNIPLFAVIIALLPPALILGTHLPLYSYYLRQKRFGSVYGFYHWGAILGLLAFEWSFVHAGSVTEALTTLGVCQSLLGLCLLYFYRKNIFKIESPTLDIPFLNPQTQKSAFVIFAMSSLSFYQIFWALKTQTALTEAFRMQLTMMSAAVFFWMAFAGIFSKFSSGLKKRSTLFFFWSLSLVLLQASFTFLPMRITDLYTGTEINYFAASFLLALYLSFPVFFSSLLFVRETQAAALQSSIDRASGFLNLVAGLGNIFGFGVAALMAAYLWSPAYFSVAILMSAGLFLLFSWSDLNLRRSLTYSGFAFLMGLGLLVSNVQSRDYLFQNRLRPQDREAQSISVLELHSNAFSTIALAVRDYLPSFQSDPDLPAASFAYFVDGHLSHDLSRGNELVTGLTGAKYFAGPLKKSLVIGVGVGQSAWAVQAISEKTDLVEISPAAIEGLDLFKEYNYDLKNRPDLSIHIQDGFSFVRNCTDSHYELILSTATYPGNFNASKLYSDEFLTLAKKCLAPNGVFQTYFDHFSVRNMRQLEEFLAPLKKNFLYVDIILKPYPLVFAYDQARSLKTLSPQIILRPEDQAAYTELEKKGLIQSSTCQQTLRNIPLRMENISMNTLDRGFLEANSFANIVATHNLHWTEQNLEDFYTPKSAFTCE